MVKSNKRSLLNIAFFILAVNDISPYFQTGDIIDTIFIQGNIKDPIFNIILILFFLAIYISLFLVAQICGNDLAFPIWFLYFITLFSFHSLISYVLIHGGIFFILINLLKFNTKRDEEEHIKSITCPSCNKLTFDSYSTIEAGRKTVYIPIKNSIHTVQKIKMGKFIHKHKDIRNNMYPA